MISKSTRENQIIQLALLSQYPCLFKATLHSSPRLSYMCVYLDSVWVKMQAGLSSVNHCYNKLNLLQCTAGYRSLSSYDTASYPLLSASSLSQQPLKGCRSQIQESFAPPVTNSLTNIGVQCNITLLTLIQPAYDI